MHKPARIDRRRLLAAASALAVGGPALGYADEALRGSALPLADDFAARLRDKFLLEDESGLRVEASLAEVRQGKFAPRAGFRKPFSIVFCPSASTSLGQATYRVKHRALGTMRLLLTPITPQGSRPLLEAVFG